MWIKTVAKNVSNKYYTTEGIREMVCNSSQIHFTPSNSINGPHI